MNPISTSVLSPARQEVTVHSWHRTAAVAFLASAALLFAAPFFLCVVLQAGFLDLANEPLAYRYFYSERIFAGETVVVGVGYLISVLHHAVYFLLQSIPAIATASLERRLDLFALITNGILTSALCLLACAAARSRTLRPSDLSLLALAIVMVMYGAPGKGFDYALMADYYFLNIILCIASLLLFQIFWRREARVRRVDALLIGAFIGLAMANKVTTLVVTGVLLIPVLELGKVRFREIALRSALAVSAMTVTFLMVHVVSYLGHPHTLRSAAKTWWQFTQNPGGEPFFWSSIAGYSHSYGYAYIVIYSALILILTAIASVALHSGGSRAKFVVAYAFVGFLACAYFVFKRPANTTLFESSIFVFTLCLIALTAAIQGPVFKIAVAASAAWWIGFIVVMSPFSWYYHLVADSKLLSREKWDVFAEARAAARDRPMEVVFPDNSFHHEGVFEFLLKGASDFPGWTVTEGKRTIIDRYAPGMTFRTIQGGIPPGFPYGGHRVIVWFDRPDIAPLTVQYPELKNAIDRQGVTQYERTVKTKGGGSVLTMRVAILP